MPDPELAPAPADAKSTISEWISWATTTLNGMVALLGAVTAFVVAVIGIYKLIFPVPTTSAICQFSEGWIDYSPLAALPVGSNCQDGSGSSGLVVVKGKGSLINTSGICQFSNGWHDYAPVARLRIGKFCQDGNGNTGIIVEKGSGSQI